MVIIGIAAAGLILTFYRPVFLYLSIFALAALNFNFALPCPFALFGRDLEFSGKIIEQEPLGSRIRVKMRIERVAAVIPKRHCSLPVEFINSNPKPLLGKTVIARGRIAGNNKNQRYYRFTGKITALAGNASFLKGSIDRCRAYITGQLRRFLRNPLYESVSAGMVLGGSRRLSPAERSVFRDAGVLHILAVSGLHVGFVMLFAGALFFFMPINRHIKIVLVCAVLLFYAALTGWRPSVLRATVMAIIFSAALISDRNVSARHVLNLTASAFLVADPLIIFDIGAQLSFAAMYGIILLYPKFKSRCIESVSGRPVRLILNTFFVSLSAQLFVFPLTNFYFHRLAPYGMISNVIIVPLASLIIFMLFLLLISGLVCVGAGYVISVPVHALLLILTQTSKFFASLPGAGLTVYIPALLIPFIYFVFFPKLRKAGIMIILVIMIIRGLPVPENMIHMRSRHAGILIELSHGTRLLVNSHKKSYAMERFLDEQGIAGVDYVIGETPPACKYTHFIARPPDFVTRSMTLGNIKINIGPGEDMEILYGGHRIIPVTQEEGIEEHAFADTRRIFRYRTTVDPSIPEKIIDETTLLILKGRLFLGL